MDTANTFTHTGSAPGPDEIHPVPLRRAVETRMVGGVAAGLAEYLDVEVALVRIVFVALALFGAIGIALYLAAWVLIPEEGSDVSIGEEILGERRFR